MNEPQKLTNIELKYQFGYYIKQPIETVNILNAYENDQICQA